MSARRRSGTTAVNFAPFDPDQHTRSVDIIDLEVGHFRHAQARTIGSTKDCLVFDARGRLEQPADFLNTQHCWQFAWIAHQHQASRQIWPVERDAEEEAESRGGAVDRGQLYPALLLMNLKSANILSRCRIRRLAEEGCAPRERNCAAYRIAGCASPCLRACAAAAHSRGVRRLKPASDVPPMVKGTP